MHFFEPKSHSIFQKTYDSRVLNKYDIYNYLGKGVFIPGFEEEVIGLKAGDEKTFSLKFPEEYR